MRRSLSALGAVLTAGAVLLPAGPAAAGETLAPGGTQTLTVTLPDWAPRADRLGVSVSGLVQLENDCVEPESESGDTTCNKRQGELADFLEATVAAGVGGENCQAGEGVTLYLFGAPTAFDVRDVDCLVLRLHFPDGERAVPDNVAQSDSITFTLDVVGEQDLTKGPVRGGGNQTAQSRGTATSGGGSDPVDGATVASPDSGGGTAPGVPPGPAGTGGARPGTAAGNGVGAAAGGAPTAPVGDAVAVPEGVAPSGEKTVIGQAAMPVTVDDDGLGVATESATSSLVAQVLSWGSLFLGAVVLGGLVFVLVRRRRRERAA
ncbi:hypothetical protein ACI782_15895 [Geodermatophilus sp. SYSU D00703]